MDKNDFFRQATLRICGNLEIEEALVSSLNFLSKEMPVDRMFLQFFEEGLNAMRTVAMATPKKQASSTAPGSGEPKILAPMISTVTTLIIAIRAIIATQLKQLLQSFTNFSNPLSIITPGSVN